MITIIISIYTLHPIDFAIDQVYSVRGDGKRMTVKWRGVALSKFYWYELWVLGNRWKLVAGRTLGEKFPTKVWAIILCNACV